MKHLQTLISLCSFGLQHSAQGWKSARVTPTSTRGEIKASLFIKIDKFSIFTLSLLKKQESAVLINEADLKTQSFLRSGFLQAPDLNFKTS